MFILTEYPMNWNKGGKFSNLYLLFLTFDSPQTLNDDVILLFMNKDNGSYFTQDTRLRLVDRMLP